MCKGHATLCLLVVVQSSNPIPTTIFYNAKYIQADGLYFKQERVWPVEESGTYSTNMQYFLP